MDQHDQRSSGEIHLQILFPQKWNEVTENSSTSKLIGWIMLSSNIILSERSSRSNGPVSGWLCLWKLFRVSLWRSHGCEWPYGSKCSYVWCYGQNKSWSTLLLQNGLCDPFLLWWYPGMQIIKRYEKVMKILCSGM